MNESRFFFIQILYKDGYFGKLMLLMGEAVFGFNEESDTEPKQEAAKTVDKSPNNWTPF
jgi:hypothetical protein